MKKQIVYILAIAAGLLLVSALTVGWQQRARAAGFSLPARVSSLPGTVSLQQSDPQQQETGAPNQTGPVAPGAVAPQADPSGQMSYQGQLLKNGTPYHGTINITFRLYATGTGGTAFWTETQAVTVEKGVFSVMLGSVTPMNLLANDLSQQPWLGIQPDGAASELAPRQLLGAVAYAYGVVPGATMVDANPAVDYYYSFYVDTANHAAIYARSQHTDSVAVDVSMTGVNSPGGAFPVGVRSSTSSADAAAIYATNSGTGSCTGADIFCPSALVAAATNGSYASRLYSDGKTLLLGRNTGIGYWDIFAQNVSGNDFSGGIYTNSDAYIGDDLTVAGSKSGYVVDIALNDGSEALERGDVVAISGVDAPVVGEIPVIRVQKATAENASSVVGVVDALYQPCMKAPESLESGERCGGFDDSAKSIEPGQYLSIVTLGAFGYLKVNALAGPIQVGDLLSVSPTSGVAAQAQMLSVEGASFYAPGTLIGKALGDLADGSGVIPVFVTIR